MTTSIRLIDFHTYNASVSHDGSSESDDSSNKKDPLAFHIQMFGISEQGETTCLIITDYKPFFYVQVPLTFNKNAFVAHLHQEFGAGAILDAKIVERKKLYGYDGGKKYPFLLIQFPHLSAFNKVKNLFYDKDRNLLKSGYRFKGQTLTLYEANIPPLLRFFHIQDISPSGWVTFVKGIQVAKEDQKSTCAYEYIVSYRDIKAINDKETRVPYKICSFDIEASSSHGDFPIPVKTYKKLATNIVEYIEKRSELNHESMTAFLKHALQNAFNASTNSVIDVVYPKTPVIASDIQKRTEAWLRSFVKTGVDERTQIETLFEKGKRMYKNDEDEEEEPEKKDEYEQDLDDEEIEKKHVETLTPTGKTIVNFLLDKHVPREDKLQGLTTSLNEHFPALEGDKVTFIGSTFLRYGEPEPYLNHMIALNTCSPVAGSIVESYPTEKEVLCAWQQVIQREDPDIIIGYNIFGFDYQFMFLRAKENDCLNQFLQCSRVADEICAKRDFQSGKLSLEETTIQIASGQHDLKYMKMTGRLQIDLYNFFRREENLTSYKLDYVAGYFIGDIVKKYDERRKSLELNCVGVAEAIYEPDEKGGVVVYSTNLTGLQPGSYIHFEEIGHSVEYYDGGAKFIVESVDAETKSFTIITGRAFSPDKGKKLRWCLAKDDVSPQDIFRLTNGTADDRAIIAKYCIQDCNLVHHLLNKVDVLTGFSEMAKICSVPMSFLVLRGQGIKLTSYIAKKCREKGTLMPVVAKGSMDEGYEGAIVLEPKCDLYLDKPVACVDYASLYPSSMISENLSHDSKVWTQEYDLEGNLIRTTGERDPKTGDFLYDNLDGVEYVDITYDTYKYVRKTPKAAATKVISGKKTCRFAQSVTTQEKAIMPSILEELLMARKATRKLIPQQTDEFMKNVLDKRQLGYKVTANSLYGQCGAKTSTFYEKDIAACTTATGRLLLTYAKRVIEECYGDATCETETRGPVKTKAEYIYGDSVAAYTPVYVRVTKSSEDDETPDSFIDILPIEDLAAKYGVGWRTCEEPGKQSKEVCEFTWRNLETWSDQGWTRLERVIRHRLAPHKKMVHIETQSGSWVDVTDDHSLLLSDGTEVSPRDVKQGVGLLSRPLSNSNNRALLSRFFDMLGQKTGSMPAMEIEPYEQAHSHLFMQHISHSVHDSEEFISYIEALPFADPPYVYDLTTANHHFAAGVGNLIVHNTDSVFFTFNLETPEGVPIVGKDALEITIGLAQEAGHLASSFLKKPHDLEYEKTFMPFCLLSKKRYVGMLYETDPNKGKRKEMGIVLKRRDNAPIVKDIYGGIIDIFMKEQNIGKAMEFLQTSLRNIVDKSCPMDKLIITKSLRSGYKNPQQIAHKVLADRMTARDPGNKPCPGDRIPYVYINKAGSGNKIVPQGERIETPAYIIEKNMTIDYSFYITNQIMKPVSQVFGLVLEKIWAMQGKSAKIKSYRTAIEWIKKNHPPEKWAEKCEDLRNKEVEELLFREFLRVTQNAKTGNQDISQFWKK